MLALFAFGFATINADEISEGIMPKRQVIGTGVAATTSADPTTTSASPRVELPAIQVTTEKAADPTTTSTPTNPPATTPTPSSKPNATVAAPSSPDTPTSPSSTHVSSSDSSSSADSSSASAPSADPTSSSQESSAVSSVATSSSMMPTSIDVTTTNSDGSTITSRVSTSTLVPASKTLSGDAVRTGTGSASHLVMVGSSTIDRATLSGKTTITYPLIAEATLPSTYTSYWTSDGSAHSTVITTSRVVSSTTGFDTATITPFLQSGGGNGSTSSSSSKRIIGGVVGGVGGAILLGGLALVAWRLRGRKKNRQPIPQDDYLDSQTESIAQEKRHSQGFRSNLEKYHTPNGAVNTASNF